MSDEGTYPYPYTNGFDTSGGDDVGWSTLPPGEEHLNNLRTMTLLVGVQIMILSFSSAGTLSNPSFVLFASSCIPFARMI